MLVKINIYNTNEFIYFCLYKIFFVWKCNILRLNFQVPVLYHGEKTFRPENLTKIKNAYDIIEKFFSGPWLTGDTLTLADICCVSTISSLNEIIPIDVNL